MKVGEKINLLSNIFALFGFPVSCCHKNFSFAATFTIINCLHFPDNI